MHPPSGERLRGEGGLLLRSAAGEGVWETRSFADALRWSGVQGCDGVEFITYIPLNVSRVSVSLTSRDGMDVDIRLR